MTDERDSSAAENGVAAVGRRSVGWLTVFAALLVIVLATGSLLWPQLRDAGQRHVLLVYDSSGDQARIGGAFGHLGSYLATITEQDLELVVANTTAEFYDRLKQRPDFVFAPDALAMGMSSTEFMPLVVGRRRAPYNLRPRSVLVYRHGAGDFEAPWRSAPTATVFGDSVSLTAVTSLHRSATKPWPRNLAVGPDPYDHGPVLQALRLGGFDFAVVRQWDAERFFASGLLSKTDYGLRELSGPVPDSVLMITRDMSAQVRLQLLEELSVLGRSPESEGRPSWELCEALGELRLTGFNVLLEPDWEQERKNNR